MVLGDRLLNVFTVYAPHSGKPDPHHAYVNRRWGNPAGTQHSPMLRQKAVYMRTLPGLMDCGKPGPFGLVPGMLTHLQEDQVN